MQYINPIEILGLSNVEDTTRIDNEIVKKAKRKLFADIDLSDNGLFEYYGLQLTKSDCEKAIDELANNDLKEFHFFLAINKNFNSFLINGDLNNEKKGLKGNTHKLLDFVKFVSPYFAPKFDKILVKAFESKDIEKAKSILNTAYLISPDQINIAYKGVSNHIQSKISEIIKIKNDIKNEESVYNEDDINEVVDLVINYFPNDILNLLPNYFQSQILKIANEINYLNVIIWDNYDNTQVCNDLLEHVLTLNIGGLDKPTFQKNYEIVRKKNQERIEQEKNAPILRKYADYLIQTKIKLKEIKDKTITPTFLLSWVVSQISVIDVNNLPTVFDEIKNQVALSLRAMSVEVWSSFSNIEVSMDLINRANNIRGLKFETRNNLQDAKKQLTELKTKIDIANLVKQKAYGPTQTRPVSRQATTSSTNSKYDNSVSLYFICFLVLLGITIWSILIKSNSNDNPTTTESNATPKTLDVNTNENSAPYKTNLEDLEPLKQVESEFKGSQLKDGASPLTECFGKGIYSGNATLTIKNGGNSDAIVCLYSISDDITIRNEYVQKNSSFTMSNIAQGEYKIRVFYGNDWNPELENSCGTKGNFESDVNFSEFDGTEFFEDSERGYTNATVTLYTVANGNASSSIIDQSQFFRK